MTDRELLEMAAKAAGYERNSAGPIGPCEWNPLTNDGDALRLAVRLGIDEVFTVAIAGGRGYVAACDANLELAGVEENLLEDPYAATRRAIVRAAAEIGKEMK